MPASTQTPLSNTLYASIVGTVAATRDRQLTVGEIAQKLDQEPSVIGSCIALHRYMRSKAEGPVTDAALTFPMPPDIVVPQADDGIDETALGL